MRASALPSWPNHDEPCSRPPSRVSARAVPDSSTATLTEHRTQAPSGA